MANFILTQNSTPIIGWCASLLGKVMEWIYVFFSNVGIEGPTIRSASCRMKSLENESYKVILDLKPALDEETLDKRIQKDFKKYTNSKFEKALEDLNVSSVKVCGLAKDDNHRTRGLYYQNVEIPIEKNSEGFRLITRIQDEAHRFAITFHRQLRSQKQVHSILDDIPGIGPARRKDLMKHFENIEEILTKELKLCA